MYYARIYGTMDHFRKVKKRIICDKIARQLYLTKEEYVAQRPIWCKENCWSVLAEEWSSSDFQKKSVANRTNRYSHKFKPHKGGSNSIAVIQQKLSKKEGREVSEVEAWVYTHRGTNPEDTYSLNTDEATACLERYKAKAIELNGSEFDWLHSPVDVRALYECSCGRRHGKWAIFNGVVNDREALAELKYSRASSMATKRRRQQEDEHIRKEANDSHVAKQYAQRMLEWGTIVRTHNDNVQRFMESLAAHIGMPATAVPPPLPPPPPPPTYGVSTSPTPSPENVGTLGSSVGVGVETPEETLSKIAYGVFGGHMNENTSGGGNELGGSVNAIASGGGNYSPPDDDFPLF